MFLQTKLMNANIALLRVGFEGTEFFACQLSSFASHLKRSSFVCQSSMVILTVPMLKNSQKKRNGQVSWFLSQNKERIGACLVAQW